MTEHLHYADSGFINDLDYIMKSLDEIEKKKNGILSKGILDDNDMTLIKSYDGVAQSLMLFFNKTHGQNDEKIIKKSQQSIERLAKCEFNVID